MQLTSHDRCVLHLASRDAEGRLGFSLDEEGLVTLLGKGETQAVPAGGSLSKLEEGGASQPGPLPLLRAHAEGLGSGAGVGGPGLLNSPLTAETVPRSNWPPTVPVPRGYKEGPACAGPLLVVPRGIRTPACARASACGGSTRTAPRAVRAWPYLRAGWDFDSPWDMKKARLAPGRCW